MLDLWHCSYLTLVFFSPVLGFLVLLFYAFLFCEFMNGMASSFDPGIIYPELVIQVPITAFLL